VRVEVLMGRASKQGQDRDLKAVAFIPQGALARSACSAWSLAPDMCGRLLYRVRVYPHHELLTHPFETGLMRWL
jgi:starch phosphorylase